MSNSGTIEIISHTDKQHYFSQNGRTGASTKEGDTLETFLPIAQKDYTDTARNFKKYFTPFEAMLAEVGDRVVEYESNRYKTQKPVAFSNWPTTDPFNYPEEVQAYLRGLESVFIALAHRYSRKNELQMAYFPFVIARYKLFYGEDLPPINRIQVDLLEKPSIYSRENALNAFYSMGISSNVADALKIIDDSGFYHNKENKGILPELYKKISEDSGIDFSYISSDTTNEQYRLAKNEQVEIVSAHAKGDVDDLTDEVHILTYCKGEEEVELCEGVETGEEMAASTDAGCDYIQGYLLARTNPADEPSVERDISFS